MDHYKVDPEHTRAMGGKRGGIVGENAIWEGPLSQVGRPHAKGASNGIRGMKLKHAGVPYSGMAPITMKAQR